MEDHKSDAHYEEIEHTADWAIRIRARDRSGLLQVAAGAMMSLLVERMPEPTTEQEITLQSPDFETLFVDWLNEILFLAEQNEVVYSEFDIYELETHELETHAPSRLLAVIRGGKPLGPLQKSIKAATFSGLDIHHDSEGWQTEIVFDV